MDITYIPITNGVIFSKYFHEIDNRRLRWLNWEYLCAIMFHGDGFDQFIWPLIEIDKYTSTKSSKYVMTFLYIILPYCYGDRNWKPLSLLPVAPFTNMD